VEVLLGVLALGVDDGLSKYPYADVSFSMAFELAIPWWLLLALIWSLAAASLLG
jgi:hypothetical protein